MYYHNDEVVSLSRGHDSPKSLHIYEPNSKTHEVATDKTTLKINDKIL